MSAIFYPNNAAILWSPYNWLVTSGSAISNEPGAYFRVNFTGTSVQINFDNSGLSSISNLLHYKWSIDDADWQTGTLAFGTNLVTLGSGLADTTHSLTFFFTYSAADISNDRWATPVIKIKIDELWLDNTKTISAPTLPTPRTKYAIIYGDSLTEAAPDGFNGYGNLIGEALDAETGVIGHAYQGWGCGTPGGIPNFFTPGNDTASSWNKYYSGQSRLSGGLFSPAPSYIIVNHGENDYQFGVSDATVTATVTAWLAAARAASPSAMIIVLAPFGGAKAAAIASGVSAYQSSNPLDRYVFFNDFGFGQFYQSGTGNTVYTNDHVHPNTSGHTRIGVSVAAYVTKKK